MEDNYKVLYLTNNENALGLYAWLKERCDTILWEKPVMCKLLDEHKPDLIVSYNYKYIIKEDVITYMQGKIVNLHISYLPWNRGSSPNIWSFVDDTPKGVTIHQIARGLDTGAILYQKECNFVPEKETFASTYQILSETIIKLFQDNWEEIKAGDYKLYEQSGKGSYHTSKDLEVLQEKCPFEWSDNIADFLKRYHASYGNSE